MAFPVVESVSSAANGSTETEQLTVTAPSGIQDGDLLIVAYDNASEGTGVLTGFTNIDGRAYASGMCRTWYKIADGESGNYTITWTNNSRACIVMARISGVDPTAPYAGTPDYVALTSGSGDPNPPLLSGVPADDYLWLAIGHSEGKRAPMTAPTNYTSGVEVETSGGGNPNRHCTLHLAHRNLNATSENPGIFDAGNQEEWAAITIPIRPGGLRVPRGLLVEPPPIRPRSR